MHRRGPCRRDTCRAATAGKGEEGEGGGRWCGGGGGKGMRAGCSGSSFSSACP